MRMKKDEEEEEEKTRWWIFWHSAPPGGGTKRALRSVFQASTDEKSKERLNQCGLYGGCGLYTASLVPDSPCPGSVD